MSKTWGVTFRVLGVAALLGLPRIASAVCQPMYNPENPGQIVGCCNASGQVMADGANCVNPANVCQEGDCLGGTCVQKPDGDWNPTNAGDPCPHPGDPCLIGTCSHQQCLNATVPACADTNQCTTDSCVLDTATPNPLDVTCTNSAAASNGQLCALPTANLATCERGTCTSGSCIGTGTTDTCTGTLPDCQAHKCLGYSGGAVACGSVNAPQFTDCRVSEWTECQHYECGTSGQCNPDSQTGSTCNYSTCQTALCNSGGTCGGNSGSIIPKPAGTACTSDGQPCTSDVCNNTGSCTHPTAPDGTPCPDNQTQCMKDQCIAGVCNHDTPHPNTQGCFTYNPCMLSLCTGTGNACGIPNPAMDGQPCSNPQCVASGICDGDTGVCDPRNGGSCSPSTTACNYCGGTCNQDPENGCTCG